MLTNVNRVLERVEGVIFDLDGTILDTMEQWNMLGMSFLQKYNITPEPSLLNIIDTMSLNESAQFFHDEFKMDISVPQIIDELEGRLRSLYSCEVKLKEGAFETLQLLKSANIKVALATATSAELAQLGLKTTGTMQFFDGIFSCRDPQIREGKTSPKIFNYVKKFLGTNLEETVVVEDALYALETAEKVGFYTIAIEDSSECVYKDQIKKIANVYVENHFELFQWFREKLN